MLQVKFPWSSSRGYRWTGKSLQTDQNVLLVCVDWWSEAHRVLNDLFNANKSVITDNEIHRSTVISIDGKNHQIVIVPVDSTGEFFDKNNDLYLEDSKESFKKLTSQIPERLEHFKEYLRFNWLTQRVKVIDAYCTHDYFDSLSESSASMTVIVDDTHLSEDELKTLNDYEVNEEIEILFVKLLDKPTSAPESDSGLKLIKENDMTTESQKKHVLLVWNEIPEGNKFYLIPEDEITPEQFKFLHEANDKFINADDNNFGLDFLNAALSPAYMEDDTKEGIWAKHKVEFPLQGQYITQAFHSGFLL
jgi:hypothetical protein